MTKKLTYQQMQSELETILTDMQREDLDVDLAIEHYERGLELVRELETYLKQAENRVTEIKAKFSDAGA